MKLITVACPTCRRHAQICLENTSAGVEQCGACGGTLFFVEEVLGFVYILSNPRMPMLVKVGSTTRSINERVAELNSATGVPSPFVVEAYFYSSDPLGDEQRAHEALAQLRLPQREFFQVEATEAIEMVSKALGNKVVFSALRDGQTQSFEAISGDELRVLVAFSVHSEAMSVPALAPPTGAARDEWQRIAEQLVVRGCLQVIVADNERKYRVTVAGRAVVSRLGGSL